jgi:hypothetical protein
MTPETHKTAEPSFQPALLLQAHLLPQEDPKTSHTYEIFAGDNNFGRLKIKHHWKILEWQGDDIFQDPQVELLDKLREPLGMKKRSELISCGIVFQDRKKKPQFTAVIAPKKSRHKIKEYEALMAHPSRIVEVRYDTAIFQVIAYNPDHNDGNSTTRLKTKVNRPYSPEIIQWALDHHADRDALPQIDCVASAHTLSHLS